MCWQESVSARRWGQEVGDTLEDLRELVLRVRAGEQRAPRRHLHEDAPDGPDVDRRGVLACAEQDLGRTVPQRHHVVRVRAHGDPERTREPKVGDLQLPVLGAEVSGRCVWMCVDGYERVEVEVEVEMEMEVEMEVEVEVESKI